jgi:hypothetical protein
MKNTLYAVIALFIMSCSATKVAGGAETKQKNGKKLLKGTWTVSDIRFVGEAGLYKADLFDVADSPCFKGGEWLFIPNNGTGRFSINGTERCSESTNRMLWSYIDHKDGTGEIQFKFVDEKNKPLSSTKTGYSIAVESISESNAEFRIKTDYEGQPFDVVFSMSKTSKEVKL